jgi:hypothetical protein
MPSDFDLIPTPDPTEFTIRIRVPDTIVNSKLVLQPNGKLERYTPYKDFSFGVRHERVSEFGDYVYTYYEQADANHKHFYFARTRTDTERNTPFETYYSTRQFAWPPVLEDLYFISSSFPQATATSTDDVTTATRYFKRQKYRPSVSVDSRIKVQLYLSETPWNPQGLLHPQPIPTEVDGSYLGLSVNFPKCLHPRIVLPELVPGAQIVFNAGAVDVTRDGTPKGQVFPATNFEDWRPFVIEDVVQPQRGLWLREKVTIYPPLRGESIEN